MLFVAPGLGCPVVLPSADQTLYRCGDDDRCAPGFVCRAGTCVDVGSLPPDSGALDAAMADRVDRDRTSGDRSEADRGSFDSTAADGATLDRSAGDSRPGDAPGTDRAAGDASDAGSVTDSGDRDAGSRDAYDGAAMPDSTAPDAAVPDSSAPDRWAGDAADASSRDALTVVCNLQAGNWSFSAPEPVAELNSAGYDRDPWLTPDGLTIYFSSDRTGSLGSSDIWMASRPDLASPFATPVNAGDFNTADNDGRLSLTFDLLNAYLSTSRSGSLGGVDIFSATRASVDDMFASFTPVANVNSVDNEHDPLISPDGLRLYFAPSNHPQRVGGQDLAIAVRARRGDSFAASTVLANVNSTSGDADPSLTFDERILLFASGRAGGLGSSDIYYAVRPDLGSDFSAALLLPVINSASSDGDPFISGDGCELYFYSNRSGGTGSSDIWRAHYLVP